MTLNPGSRARLTRRTRELFTGDSLFDRIARVVCDAECLPRKELYEAWEVARRIRRVLRGRRIVELAAGHGLVAITLLLLDDSSPDAVCYDPARPQSFGRLWDAMQQAWPRLEGRVSYRDEDARRAEVHASDLLVSVHACGELTDSVLDLGLGARCPVAVLPCCHDLRACATEGLESWMDGPVAVDAVRLLRMRAAGYQTLARTIPAEITPQNRLLIALPEGSA